MKLDIELITQEGDTWCWAACIQMFLAFSIKNRLRGISSTIPSQSEITNASSIVMPNLQKDDNFSFQIDIIKNCEEIYSRLIENSSNIFLKYTLIDAKDVFGVMAYFKNEEMISLPIFALIKQGQPSGHFVLITGYEEIGNEVHFFINNPGIFQQQIQRNLNVFTAEKQRMVIDKNGISKDNFTILKYLALSVAKP